MILIYGLVDPRCPDIVRYVGQTSNPGFRLSMHRRGEIGGVKGRTYSANWIRKLKTEGVLVDIVELDYTDTNADAHYLERLYIFIFRTLQRNLTNMTDGGDGVRGCIPSLETRLKISAGQLGKLRGHISPAIRYKMRLVQLGKHSGPKSAEHRAKLSAAKMGKSQGPLSLEHCQKIADALRGKSHTAERKIAIALGCKRAKERKKLALCTS